MLIALFISLILGGAEATFEIEKLDKQIKTHVSEESRRDTLLEITKEAEKKIKAFNKQHDKDLKSVKRMTGKGLASRTDLDAMFDKMLKDRNAQQEYLINARLQTQDLMTADEWQNVIESAVFPSEKDEKKEDKSESKVEETIKDLMNEIRKAISDEMEDPDNLSHILTAVDHFEEDVVDHVEKARAVSFENNTLVRNQNANRIDLEKLYEDQNVVRQDMYNSFVTVYEISKTNTTEKEWASIRKALKKVF